MEKSIGYFFIFLDRCLSGEKFCCRSTCSATARPSLFVPDATWTQWMYRNVISTVDVAVCSQNKVPPCRGPPLFCDEVSTASVLQLVVALFCISALLFSSPVHDITGYSLANCIIIWKSIMSKYSSIHFQYLLCPAPRVMVVCWSPSQPQ